MVPWKSGGKFIVWDAISPDTFALSHLANITSHAGAVTAVAEEQKEAKYISLVPVAIESTGIFGPGTLNF